MLSSAKYHFTVISEERSASIITSLLNTIVYSYAKRAVCLPVRIKHWLLYVLQMSKEESKILQRYWNYIGLCQGKDGEKFSSTKELYFLINQAQDVLPEHSTYVTNILNKQNIVTESEIENTLSKVNFKI